MREETFNVRGVGVVKGRDRRVDLFWWYKTNPKRRDPVLDSFGLIRITSGVKIRA